MKTPNKLSRRMFIKLAGVSLGTFDINAISGNTRQAENLASKRMKGIRKEQAQKIRRIIMNNDGNELRNLPDIQNISPKVFLNQRTSGIVKSQIDTLSYCTGIFNLYTHQSTLSELAIFGKTGFLYKQLINRFATDPLGLVVDFCKKNNKECFWSMRMNDTHDSYNVELLSRWKKSNNHLLMAAPGTKFKYGGGRWSALNYEYPEVRKRVVQIIADVVSNYDIDGVELDFFRHPVYFRQQLLGEKVTQKQCDFITNLLKSIQDLLLAAGVKRNRPILLTVRVPDSISFAKEIGLDILKWLQLQLVDFLIVGGYFRFHNWDKSVALGREFNIPIYGCLEVGRIQAKARGGLALKKWRREALQAWEAGIDGIYTFNALNPLAPIFKEIGNPTLLKTLRCVDAVTGINPYLWTTPDKWLKNGNEHVSNN